MSEPRLGLLVYKIPREGVPPFVFDFSELELSFDVARALRRSLEAQMGHTSIQTQAKAFMALRKLSKCLEEHGIRNFTPLPANVLPLFADWLDKSSLGPSAQVSLTKVRQLFSWCERNVPNILAKDFNLIIPRIRTFEFGAAKPGLSDSDIRTILRACYEEIERVEQERAQIRRIFSGRTASSEERDFLLLTRDLMFAGKGQLAKQPVYHRAGKTLSRRVEAFGGSRRIAEVAYLSPRDLLPFFIAILAQVSGNPDSIRAAHANCVVPHPIRDDIERLVWIKSRSARQQKAEFPKDKDWSAPNLVRRLNALTDGLRAKAVRSARNKLFICYRWYSRTFGMPEKGSMLNELRLFIERHSLPAFQFKDLRRSGAQIVQSIRGSFRDAQQHLNHQDSNTIRRYAATQSIADSEDQVIHQHQVQFARLAKGRNQLDVTAKTDALDLDIPVDGMETIFGFRCKDPLAGIAPGSVRGSMCLKFFGCASCAGSFVPLDNIEVVARLIASAEALGEARERAQVDGWWKRYQAIYEPVRVRIVGELLPSVSQPILQRARALASSRLIPYLE